MTQKTRIYRHDYTPSCYLIQNTDLHFEVGDDGSVIVSATLVFYQNPESHKGCDLFLDGEDLVLISIFINGKTPEYTIMKNGIQLYNLPKNFTLKTQVKIYPNKNTTLNGLYQSGGMFCTQCEAQGFRHITYYLDRPDILSKWRVRISADKNIYPTQLSNGDFENGFWIDPHPKPCYLFALVIGDLALTQTQHKGVSLEIYTEKHNVHKTDFAIQSLIRAMDWDEARFGFKYDLARYMIVAVDDFNMGAMENKGLNIFNSTYVLADEKSATDTDFLNVEAVIGHEYFHNWTGNRITCRDWFQLSLKEGLTVFRDQEFTSDLHARSIKRIEDVRHLRTFQFAEDIGSMRHPVRPESYIEMNNFYTMTVYEKGAELIRMMHTLLGEVGFQKGMMDYVQNFDGKAVTIDDFVMSMSRANAFDFSNFMPWYECAGTPEVHICQTNGKVVISQTDARLTPIKYGVLDTKGQEIEAGVLQLNQTTQSFDFSHLPKGCVFSWLRDFCAPVALFCKVSIQERIFLMTHDSDAFNQWDNAQKIWLDLILTPKEVEISEFFQAIDYLINTLQDKALLAELLTLPSEKFIHTQVKTIDIFAIHTQRETLIQQISIHFGQDFLKIYHQLNTIEAYDLSEESVGKRALKNLCLQYLVQNKTLGADLAYLQFKKAQNMSDKLSALQALILQNGAHKNKALADFYQEFKHDTQVMDKYFALQAGAKNSDIEYIKKLMKHELFSFNNPNRMRSVVSTFASNMVNFHTLKGYEFFTDIILKLDKTNPQIGARLVSVYNHWHRFTPVLKNNQKQQLERIFSTENLSNDIFEIVQAALK
jgi:aminopeptidase N